MAVEAGVARPRPGSGLPYTQRAGEPLLGPSEAGWDKLALRSENVFATPEWLSVWWRHFGADREAIVARAGAGDHSPLSVLPICRFSRGRLRLLRFLGHGPSDQMGAVCAPEDEERAAASLRVFVSELPGWDVFLAERLPARRDWARLLGGAEIARDSSPTLPLGGLSWEDYLASQSQNFRQQLRRRERKLEREHELRYRLADDPDRLDSDLDTLFRLHEARWGVGSRAFDGPLALFHREFAHLALERRWLRLWFLELGGRPVAAWYGFRFAGVDSFYQSGRDPDYDRLSVGGVLLAHTIREAMTDGAGEYRFLRGDEAYKSRFTTTDEGLQSVVVARTLRGRSWATRYLLRQKLRARAGRLVKRRAS